MIDTEAIRNKVLSLALQGKLTKQNSADSDVKQLLTTIVQKKNIVAILSEFEQPYCIPSNWCWLKLGWVMGIDRGASPRPIKAFITTKLDGINWIKIGDVAKDGKYITETKEKIKPEGEKKSRRVFPGDFLLTNSMSYGRPYISKIEGCIHDGWLVLRNTEEVFNLDFLYYLLSSTYVFAQFSKKASGSTVDNLNKEKVGDAIVPLPPIEEQRRIVTAIEKVFILIDTIDDLQTRYAADRDVLKGKLIDAAICGKLTKQMPEDGTAEELYKQIQAEKKRLIKAGKIKKDKPLPEITDDKKPFDIPESWKWVRLEAITYSVGNKGNQILAKEVKRSGLFPAVSQGAALIDGFCDNVDKVINDLPLVMFGDHTRNVKYIDFPFVISADGTKFMRVVLANPLYLFYWMKIAAEKLRNRGYARHFSLLKKEAIPLPPLAEQKRIVEILDSLLENL